MSADAPPVSRVGVDVPLRHAVEITAIAERPIARDEQVELLIVEAATHYWGADSKELLAKESEEDARNADAKARALRLEARKHRQDAVEIVGKLRALGIT